MLPLPASYESLPIIAPRVARVDEVVRPFPGMERAVRIVFYAGENEDAKPWLLFTPLTLTEVHSDIEAARTSGSLLVLWVGMRVDQNIHDATGKPVLIGITNTLRMSTA